MAYRKASSIDHIGIGRGGVGLAGRIEDAGTVHGGARTGRFIMSQIR